MSEEKTTYLTDDGLPTKGFYGTIGNSTMLYDGEELQKMANECNLTLDQFLRVKEIEAMGELKREMGYLWEKLDETGRI